MAKGIAYFKDGHEEEILHSIVYSKSGLTHIDFMTPSGAYVYEEFILEGPVNHIEHRFYTDLPRLEEADIQSIKLEMPFPHYNLCGNY